MKKNKKICIVAVLLVFVLAAMSFGYAVWTQTITVNASATAQGSMLVSISQLKYVKGDTLSSGSGYREPTSSDFTTLSDYDYDSDNNEYDVAIPDGLEYPGDGVILRVTLKNYGTMDARLDGTVSVTGDNDNFKCVVPTFGTNEVVLEPDEEYFFDVVITVDESVTDSLSSESLKFTIDGLDFVQVAGQDPIPTPSHY